ncbi:MAG TPA: ceramidase domain-containing protein [Steroidobacteraceae bacterium]|nr:ceramidase domain-containing protein [Steroidobacteraceae bacterium]
MTAVAGGLRNDWRGWLLLGSLLAGVLVALLVPPMPQPLSYHAFADCRAFGSIPNALNVLSNLPFLVAGALGLGLILRGGGSFIEQREAMPYLVFFLGALLTSVGSAYYHWAPDNARLVWDRLPMTLGFAGLVAAACTERADPRVGLRLLWPLMLVGAMSVVYWHATERVGRGNVIPYGLYQGWSILAIVLLIAAFPARRYTHASLLAWAAVWYGLAKVFETCDLGVYRLTGGVLSGHTIKHLLAAGAVFAVLRQLRLRRARSDPTLAQPS